VHIVGQVPLSARANICRHRDFIWHFLLGSDPVEACFQRSLGWKTLVHTLPQQQPRTIGILVRRISMRQSKYVLAGWQEVLRLL
jgi:hypothetical protein